MTDELAALARSLAPEAEKLRRLPDELVARLRASGLFRAGAPAATGAAEAPPAQTLRLAETVARGDASAGWCVSIAATSSLLGGWLSPAGLTEVFGDAAERRGRCLGAAGEPRVASTVAIACRADGRSAAASRTPMICSGDASSTAAVDGAAGRRGCSRCRSAELEIVDTWQTSGLNATGSHDAVADDVFVPEHRSLWLFDPPTSEAALYRFPIFGFFALSIAAAALGNARGAIDDLQSSSPRARSGSGRAARSPSAPRPGRSSPQNEAALRAAAGLLLRGDRRRLASAQHHVGAGLGRAAHRASAGGDPRGTDRRRRRPRHVRPRRRHRDLRRLAAAAPLPGRAHGDRALPGQRGDAGALRTPAARSADRHHACCEPRRRRIARSGSIAPTRRRVEIARAAGCGPRSTVWVGEMATFDAFALATAIGLRTERVG